MMLCPYRDITDRLGDPLWWDEAGVPRYVEFGPNESNNIYATEVALLEVACQSCHNRMRVAMSYHCLDDIMVKYPAGPLSGRVEALHYGDPPCWECAGGATMNCIDIRVIEFWQAQPLADWKRLPELEIGIVPDWADWLPEEPQ